MIYHMLYISEKTPTFNEDKDLQRILEISRVNNKKKNITGLLIKNGDFFIQLLEGGKEDVIKTFNYISSDPRHMKIKMLVSYQDKIRLFPGWDMGLADNNKLQVNINELIPLLHENILKNQESRDKVITILKKFNTL